MIRVALVAGTFTAALGLLIIARAAEKSVAQSPTPVTLEQEIKRVEAEIDKIFAGTLTQLPSIPAGTAHRTKRVRQHRRRKAAAFFRRKQAREALLGIVQIFYRQ